MTSLVEELINGLTGVTKEKDRADKLAKEKTELEKKNSELALQKATLEASNSAVNTTQADITKIEAMSPSNFKSGWRPALGWVCVIGMAYQFALLPLVSWAVVLLKHFGVVDVGIPAPEPIDTEGLYGLVAAMLGHSAIRSWDKKNGTASL